MLKRYTKIHHVIYIDMKHVIVTTLASTITVPRNVVLKITDIFIPMITRLVTAAIAAAAAVAATKTTIARSCENFSIMWNTFDHVTYFRRSYEIFSDQEFGGSAFAHLWFMLRLEYDVNVDLDVIGLLVGIHKTFRTKDPLWFCVRGIACIGHNRHWCIFFKPVYFLAWRTRNSGLFWPISAILLLCLFHCLVMSPHSTNQLSVRSRVYDSSTLLSEVAEIKRSLTHFLHLKWYFHMFQYSILNKMRT